MEKNYTYKEKMVCKQKHTCICHSSSYLLNRQYADVNPFISGDLFDNLPLINTLTDQILMSADLTACPTVIQK